MRVDPERLLAALLASHPGLKLDYNAIARAYGEGANYNTVEHKFRRYRKEAEVLRAQAQAADEDPTAFTPQPRAPRAPRTPRPRQPKEEPGTTPAPKGRRRKATKAKETSPIVVDSDDDSSPVKSDTKGNDLLEMTETTLDKGSQLRAKKRKRESSAPVDLTSIPASVYNTPETSRAATRDNGTVPESSTVSDETQDPSEDVDGNPTGGPTQGGEYEEV